MNCECCESGAEYGVDFGYGGRMNLCRDCMLAQGELHRIVDIGAPVEKRPTDPPVIEEDGVGMLGMVACLPYVALGAALVTLLLTIARAV